MMHSQCKSIDANNQNYHLPVIGLVPATSGIKDVGRERSL